jgi:hypothetical protein
VYGNKKLKLSHKFDLHINESVRDRTQNKQKYSLNIMWRQWESVRLHFRIFFFKCRLCVCVCVCVFAKRMLQEIIVRLTVKDNDQDRLFCLFCALLCVRSKLLS